MGRWLKQGWWFQFPYDWMRIEIGASETMSWEKNDGIEISGVNSQIYGLNQTDIVFPLEILN